MRGGEEFACRAKGPRAVLLNRTPGLLSPEWAETPIEVSTGRRAVVSSRRGPPGHLGSDTHYRPGALAAWLTAVGGMGVPSTPDPGSYVDILGPSVVTFGLWAVIRS